MGGLDDEEYARDDAARAEEEWGSEFERQAEHDATIGGRCEMGDDDMMFGSDVIDEAVGLYQNLPTLDDEVTVELALQLLDDVEEIGGGQLQRLEDMIAGWKQTAAGEG